METRTRMVGGARHRWLEHGAGPLVVLIHGIPTSPLLWRHVVPLVRGRCLAWEMHGYGDSIGNGQKVDLSLSAQADRFLAWLDDLEIESPVVAGHDLGGGVAQIAATRQPARFAGIVLANAVCYDSWPITSVKAMQRIAPVLRYLPHPLLYPAFAQLLHRGHDDAGRARESIALHWAPYVSHGAASALVRQVAALNTSDTLGVADQLPKLGLPAAVVWGMADPFQKARYGERLAADLGTRLRPIHGGKHFTPEDHPDQVAAAINSML